MFSIDNKSIAAGLAVIVLALMLFSGLPQGHLAGTTRHVQADIVPVHIYGASPHQALMGSTSHGPATYHGPVVHKTGTRAESDLLEDKWKLSNFYTIKDSFFFSYYDDTTINVSDSQNNQVASLNLDEGEYAYKALQAGTYFVNATEKHSCLIGDPTMDGVCGYSVVDDKGFGVFTNAYTFLPLHQFPGTERTIIWATKDNTEVTVTDMNNGQILWQGQLAKGAHIVDQNWASMQIRINATKPVQCLVYFDSGYFLPATTGLFSGKEFYGYVGMVGGWYQDINIFSYEPNTQVTVKDASGGVVWSGTLGQYECHTITKSNEEFYFTVESTKNVTVGNYPFASYDSGYYHLTFVPDKTGSGIGNEILVGSMTGGYLYVFGYFDDTTFQVYDAASGQLISTHTIQKGEAVDVNPGHGLYRIVSEDKPISCLEGYMTFGSSFAWPLFGGATPRFDIIPTPYDDGTTEPLVKHAKPGETVTYNLTVVNRYERDETVTIDLNVTLNSDNWTAWLDKTEVELGRGGWENIVLSVKAPTDFTVIGDVAVVNVSGVMVGNENVTDRISTYTILDPSIDFSVSWGIEKDLFTNKKTISAAPGDQKIVNVNIVNMGYINDTYDIYLEGAPPGWTASFEDNIVKTNMTLTLSNVQFPSENGATIPVFITPAVTALNNDMAVITVTAVSQASGEYLKKDIERFDDLYVRVTGKADLSLKCDDNTKHLKRGSSTSFDIEVINDGSTTLSVTMGLSGNSDETTVVQPDVWGAKLDLKSFSLGPNQKKHVTLTVTAPSNGLSDERLISSITAKGTGSTPEGMITYRAKPIQTTAIILPAHQINATLFPGIVDVNAGGHFSVNISIDNLGNLIETVTPQINDIGSGWNYSFYYDDYKISSIDIGIGENEVISMQIEVPLNTIRDSDTSTPAIDPYKVIINLTTENTYTLVSIIVNIGQIHDFTVSYYGKDFNDVRPGGISMYPMMVTNNGNWYDEVNIDVDGLGGDWISFISSIDTALMTEKDVTVEYNKVVDAASVTGPYSLIPNGTDYHTNVTVRLAPQQVIYVQIGIVVPNNAPAQIYDFSVNAQTKTGTETNNDDNSLKFQVHVKIPNPFLSSVKMPSELEEGKIITITATVGNSGDIACENLKVQLVVDGKPVEEKEVVNIEPGKKAIVTFTWRVSSGGHHKIEVKVDPDNEFKENNEKDNNKAISVNAASSNFFTPGFDIAPAISAMILSLILIFIYAVRRRRK